MLFNCVFILSLSLEFDLLRLAQSMSALVFLLSCLLPLMFSLIEVSLGRLHLLLSVFCFSCLSRWLVFSCFQFLILVFSSLFFRL